MFTGIVEEIGTIVSLEKHGNWMTLGIHCPLPRKTLLPGSSLAVDGVCLTVTTASFEKVSFDVSHETMETTKLKHNQVGDRLHLERALSVGGRLGGHYVTGHVDGIGEVLNRKPVGSSLDLTILAPLQVQPYLVPKGSIALDGVSLTVNDPNQSRFRVILVPHTLQKTKLSDLRSGDPVNMEADILGKYLRHFLGRENTGGVTEQLLAEHGFTIKEPERT